MQQKPSIGRIVHYTLPNGEIRPATIVRVWNTETGGVNLQVHLDGTNDQHSDVEARYKSQVTAEEAQRGTAWRTSVLPASEPTPWRWHWPPHVA
jgi:hypothetical protein